MGAFLSVAGPIAVLGVMVFGGAALSRNLFSAGHTSDGDTIKNRLDGRGPNHQPWDGPGQPTNGWAEDGER